MEAEGHVMEVVERLAAEATNRLAPVFNSTILDTRKSSFACGTVLDTRKPDFACGFTCPSSILLQVAHVEDTH